MEVRATAKYIKISSRKVRLVVDLVRGLPVEEAMSLLQHMPQRAAVEVNKAVKSAVANAENNYNLSFRPLFVSRISADEGPTQKRYRPRSRGRVSPILKRSSHISVVLDELGQ
ncbi:MAG: 50S ribosomal protein L22 [Chloroflexi bacterium]|nr:50S ribosomal protein L22 [Chloroflexota bacterium]